MTNTDETRTFHARATGLTLSAYSPAGDAIAGRVLYKGETFTVSPEEYELSKDRTGRSWVDLTPEEQVQRWGMQKFAEGPAPEGVVIGDDDDHLWFKRAITALDAAKKLTNPAERKAALQAVNAEYGKYLLDLHQDYR